MASQLPERLPRVCVSAIFRRKKDIAEDAAVLGYLRTTPRGDYFEAFVRAVHNKLPKYVPYDHVRESMYDLAGHDVTSRALDSLSWRLAANVSKLKAGPVYAWRGQTSPEWVVSQVVGVYRGNNYSGMPGAFVELLVLSGSAVGCLLVKFWTVKFARFLSDRAGFSKPWKPTPMEDMSQYFGMRMYLHLTPEKSKETPDFDVIDFSPSMLAWNKELLKKRSRLDDELFKCPCNLPKTLACHNCVIGVDRCPAATHQHTYVKKFCEACNKESWFDPAKPRRKLCVPCWNLKLANERKKKK